MQAELRNRLIAGPLLGAATIAALVVDMAFNTSWGALAVALVIAITATPEFVVLARGSAGRPVRAPLFTANLLLPLIAVPDIHRALLERLPAEPVALVLGTCLVWAALLQTTRGIEGFIHSLGGTVLGMLYIGLSMHLLVALGAHDTPLNPVRGTQLLLTALAVCKLGDVAAFFGGRACGRHKMAPSISPGKTWEGFVFSLVGSVAAAYLTVYLVSGPWMRYPVAPFAGYWQPLLFGLVVGPAGVMGDLVESCLKRSSAVKDSGSIVPGFGGFLDVYDAILLSVPVACLLALLPG